MKICYIGCHEQLSKNETKILRKIGHEVTSIGWETIPTPEDNSGITYIQPGFHRDAGLVYLTKNYLKQFDLVISCYYHENLFHVIQNYDGPIILRTINSIHSRLEELYKEACDKRDITVIRMNEKENEHGRIKCDAIIRESINEDTFNGWTGQEERVITVGKNFYGRFDIDFDLYDRVTTGMNRLLIGEQNPKRDDTLVGISDAELIKIMQTSKINYVHPRNLGCMTYGFAESMMMGMPTVCLNERWFGPNWMGSTYIKNGINGYCCGNIDELRYVINSLMKMNVDKLTELSYNSRLDGMKLFGKKVNTELWKQILQ